LQFFINFKQLDSHSPQARKKRIPSAKTQARFTALEVSCVQRKVSSGIIARHLVRLDLKSPACCLLGYQYCAPMLNEGDSVE